MLHGLPLDRRALLGAGAALLLPRRLFAAPLAGFTHGVSSGEPTPRSMLLWTRYVSADGRPTPLRVEVATDPRMTRIISRAETVADPANDWCAKATVTGLEPGRTHYYRFTTGMGRKAVASMTGRTKTLPEGTVPSFRLAVFSCSNLPFGWFNAYAHAVAADEADLVVHLGDYLYEYPRGEYPSTTETVPGRLVEPATEILTYRDYCARYASYHADPDLQALHARFPVVSIWDDHETANDSYAGGAENHDARTEGPWEARLAAATKARRDWLPVGEASYARYDIGDLATLFRLDTRIEGRDRPLDMFAVMQSGPDPVAALARLRENEWIAGNRRLVSVAQDEWLAQGLAESRRSGRRWQVLAQQVVMGRLNTPLNATEWLRPDSDPRVVRYVQAGIAATRAGLPANMDAWDGYPAARARVLAAAQQANANLVVLAGDSHNAWAFDLPNMERPAGVEFAGQSVTSPGYEAYLRGTDPATVARTLMQSSPDLRWADTSRRGYMQVTLSAARADCEWRFTQDIRQRSPQLAAVVRGGTAIGTNRLAMG